MNINDKGEYSIKTESDIIKIKNNKNEIVGNINNSDIYLGGDNDYNSPLYIKNDKTFVHNLNVNDLILKEKKRDKLFNVGSYFSWLDNNRIYRENKDNEYEKYKKNKKNEIEYINKELENIKIEKNNSNSKIEKLNELLNKNKKIIEKNDTVISRIDIENNEIKDKIEKYILNTDNELLELKNEKIKINKDILNNKNNINEIYDKIDTITQLYYNKK